jgi:hypothetical protein
MENLTPEQAVALLRKEGLEISLERAAEVIELLRLFASIIVEQYLKEHSC